MTAAIDTLADMLIAAAPSLPRRDIPNERGLYLSRYTVADKPGGGHVYLHHFHASDATGDLHSHPWAGHSFILRGGYREERRLKIGSSVASSVFVPGDVNVLWKHTFHRVDLLDPVNGCWTLFETADSSDGSWGFWNRESGLVTPWREALRARGITPHDEGT